MRLFPTIWFAIEFIIAVLFLAINNSLVCIIIAAALVADACLQISFGIFKDYQERRAKAIQEEQERKAKAIQEEQERRAKAIQEELNMEEKGYRYLFNPDNLDYVRQQLLTIINADDPTDMHKLFNRLPGKMKNYESVKSFAENKTTLDSSLLMTICDLLHHLYLPSRETRFFSDLMDIESEMMIDLGNDDIDFGNYHLIL